MNRAIYILSAVAIVGAAIAWLATGARPFTRFQDEQNAEVIAESSLDDLFADTGLNETQGEVGKIENVFAFGLLPSGPGRDTMSVAAVAGPALTISALAWYIRRRKNNAHTTIEGVPDAT